MKLSLEDILTPEGVKNVRSMGRKLEDTEELRKAIKETQAKQAEILKSKEINYEQLKITITI